MRKITEVTRIDIIEYIKNGFVVPIMVDRLVADWIWVTEQDGEQLVKINFNGKISPVVFFNRLYHLEKMPSNDKSFPNALEEIKHGKPEFWFFEDERFKLKEGFEDEPLLNFLCAMFHPVVRDENSPWQEFLNKINELLNQDGYEIYSSGKMSGRNVYSYREVDPNLIRIGMFKVFSARYSDFISKESDNLIDHICNGATEETKTKLISTLIDFSEQVLSHPIPNNPNFDVVEDETYIALEKLNEIHQESIIELNEIGHFGDRYVNRLKTIFTPYLFDIIELQYVELSSQKKEQFAERINFVFTNAHLPFTLLESGSIELNRPYEVLDNSIIKNIESINEPVLRELLNQAIALHKKTDFESRRLAMEKIWDAFERLKTYYDKDKKTSAPKIISDMSGAVKEFAELFDKEFFALTKIGNDFQIRHYEKDKTPITDFRHFDYLFNRCLSLLGLAIQYLPNGKDN